MSADFPNVNALWSHTLAESLRRKGVAYAIVCPGSRSAPLAFAFAEITGIEAIPILDERSAAFFGLGLAKRTGRPVALVCTSGSAVAHFFPAIIEASELGLPLIAITADRPPELRDCAAGQAIDQVKLFGNYVRHQVELAVPENAATMLRYLRQTIAHAVDRSTGPDAGPVHINAPFRDPLPPLPIPGFAPTLGRRGFADFFRSLTPAHSAPNPVQPEATPAGISARGLVLIGHNAPVDAERWSSHVAAFCQALGWPVLADALNPVRSRSEQFPYLSTGYEFILRSESAKAELKPDQIICIGSLPTCKALREWLAGMDIPMTFFVKRLRDQDALRGQSNSVLWDFEQGTPSVERARFETTAYRDAWLAADKAVVSSLTRRMGSESALFEGKVAWLLGRALPAGSVLCVSNSMPPRDLEFYFPASNQALMVYGSRGANGIDGIVSTALGVAHDGRPTFALVGDLAFLHDSNSCLIAPQLRGSLTIILIDNRGGGIFGMLPVAAFEPVFTKHFITEQDVRFAQLAAAYGIPFLEVADWEAFERALGEQVAGVRILYLRTKRASDAAQRKRWFQEIAADLG